MKKALIIGANRGIGKALANYYSSNYDVLSTSRAELDLCNTESVGNFINKIKDVYFDLVIFSAAQRSEEVYNMFKVNLFSYSKILENIQIKEKLVLITSTGGVFSWTQESEKVPNDIILHKCSKAAFNMLGLCYHINNPDIITLCICPGNVLTKLNFSGEIAAKEYVSNTLGPLIDYSIESGLYINAERQEKW